MKRLSLLAAVTLAAALLYLSLRGIAWPEVGRTLRGGDPGRLLVAAALVSLTLWLRAVRWRVLLNAEGRIDLSTAFWATAAGLFGNNFLPARAGELVRTAMITAGTGLGASFVLTTALAERVADAIVLGTISAVVLLAVPAPPGWLATAARPFAIAGLCGALAIAVLPLLASRVSNAHVQNVVRGLRAFHDARRLAVFLALTAAIWLLDAAGTVLAGAAFGLQFPLAVAFLLIASLGVASALPSTPGYVGIYQFVAVSVLTPFGFSRASAIAYILAAQALMYVVIGAWGAIGMLRYRTARRAA